MMEIKNREFYLKHVDYLPVEDIIEGIRNNIFTMAELRATGDFDASKQKSVKKILAEFEAEDNAFNSAITMPLLEDFKYKYPNSEHIDEVNKKINRLKEQHEFEKQKKFNDTIKNINKKTPDLVKSELGEDFLREICRQIGVDYDIVEKYDEPDLVFNNLIPENADDIPHDFTDVFFWGIPSSGKTCALSAILNTINRNYTMEAPKIKKKYGGPYRDSLVEIFKNDTGYLPSGTAVDKTQYMPFRLKKRGRGEVYRNISFFELSGEIFKFFYDIINNEVSTDLIVNQDNNDEEVLTEEQQKEIEKRIAFKTLKLLLNSNNQKIHFFFIDYEQETKKKQEQEKYLRAAAVYFRDYDDIFKKKTDAVYIVVTKADEIKDEYGNEIDDKKRSEIAGQFLNNNFGSFMDSMEERCKSDSVNFRKRIFSIGDVYFSKICKINRKYSRDIIDDLLTLVRPSLSEYKWYSKLFKLFNS